MSEPHRPVRCAGAGISTIVGERRLLGEVAERLLGSARDAEDVVRETYARWYAMPQDVQEEVGWPTAWLVSVASRLCCDRLNRARPIPPRAAGRPRPGEGATGGRPAGARTPGRRRDRVVQVFKDACEGTGEVAGLAALLAPGVVVITDGGGRVRVPLQPVSGTEQAARYLLGLFGGQAEVTFAEASINGGPGLVVRVAGTTAAVVVLHLCDDLITDVWIVMNPDKLGAFRGHDDPPTDTTRT
ncbi:sigma factor [Streptosporangium sp. NPDC002721]|uniref:sigma factor n=1 Tax=Streptosporangium sp. NPDC002721 TaxID=3366188 RepID=UPI0036A1B03B